MVFTDMAGSDVERAIEALLQITDDSVDTAEAASAEQAGSDELLALQMLQQMMNEEDMAKADADKVFRRIHEDVEKKAAFKNTPKGAPCRSPPSRRRGPRREAKRGSRGVRSSSDTGAAPRRTPRRMTPRAASRGVPQRPPAPV